MSTEVTDKASKQRARISEAGRYMVKNGRVAREEFVPHAQSEG